MKALTSKTKFSQANSQSGVTLLLAILIMASVVTIVFSISAIALNEIRSSGDLIKSEPAITAAEAGAEDVLYYTERGLASVSSNCSTPTTSSLANGVGLAACTNYYYPNPYTFSMGPNAERDFFLYNPTNIVSPPGYTRVTVSMNTGLSASIHLCTWTVADCPTSADISTSTISIGSSFDSGPLNPSDKYQLIILNGPLSANLTMNGQPLAITAGTATIQTTGSNNGVTRKIQTVVP